MYDVSKKQVVYLVYLAKPSGRHRSFSVVGAHRPHATCPASKWRVGELVLPRLPADTAHGAVVWIRACTWAKPSPLSRPPPRKCVRGRLAAQWPCSLPRAGPAPGPVPAGGTCRLAWGRTTTWRRRPAGQSVTAGWPIYIYGGQRAAHNYWSRRGSSALRNKGRRGAFVSPPEPQRRQYRTCAHTWC
jgi:hypothetical protein